MKATLEKEKIKLGIISMIPNSYSFIEFNEDMSGESINNLIKFLHTNSLISESTIVALKAFIEENALESEIPIFPTKISFKDIIKKLKAHSFRQLAEQINQLSKDMQLGDVQVSNTMFSRLTNEPVNTPKKRNTLRLLSLWIGYKRPQLIYNWNYESLVKLCDNNTVSVAKNGVRIAFALQGRGDVINEKTLKWFKNELNQIIKDLNIKYASFEGSDSFQVNEFTIDLHSEHENQTDSYIPIDYGKTVTDAIAIAHQMTIRWPLSPHINQRQNIAIGIATGEFSKLNIYLKSLLNANLDEDAIIRVTEFTRLCVITNDIRVNFCKEPERIHSADDEIIKVWWLTSLWSNIYYDFIPILLTEKMLPTTRETFIKFKESLFIPQKRDSTIHIALSAIHRYPQNTLLIIEITKVCFFRKMFHVANMIISTLLASNFHHVVARSMRMHIFLNLALEQQDLSVAKIYFQQSINEGLFISKYCAIEDEEPWCEFGIVYLGVAFRILSISRKKDKGEGVEDVEFVNYDNFINYLQKARKCFQQGLTFSPSGLGNRSGFWVVHTQTLIELFQSNDTFFSTKQPIRDLKDIYAQNASKYYTFSGWIDELFDFDFFIERAKSSIEIYETSVLLKSYIPNMKYAFAIMQFDFNPLLTTGDVKQVLDWLYKAKTSANDLIKHKLGIYSILNCFAQIQIPEEFIDYINKIIVLIKDLLKDDLTKKDDNPIDKNKLKGIKLILLHIDEWVKPGILV